MAGTARRTKLGATASGCNIDGPERVHSRPVDHVHGICKQFYRVVGLHRLLSRHSSSSTSNSGSVPIYPHLRIGCRLNRTDHFLALVIRALARLSVAEPLLEALDGLY